MNKRFAKLKAITLTARQKAQAIGATVGTGLLVLSTHVHAELPASVATDVTAAKGDIGDAGGLAIGILLAILLFVWLRRVLK